MNPGAYNNSEVDKYLEDALSQSPDQANSYWSKAAYINNNSGFAPNADAPWIWVADYDYCYFVKNTVDMVQHLLWVKIIWRILLIGNVNN